MNQNDEIALLFAEMQSEIPEFLESLPEGTFLEHNGRKYISIEMLVSMDGMIDDLQKVFLSGGWATPAIYIQTVRYWIAGMYDYALLQGRDS